MARWYYRSVFDELQDLRDYLESLNRQIAGCRPGMFLPAAPGPAQGMLPALPAAFSITVSETRDDVVVTAAMAPGITKEALTLDLISPSLLEITYVSARRGRDEDITGVRQEWIAGSVTRSVPLPEPVTREGSSARFRDSTLEVRLKKTRHEAEGAIFID